MKTGLVLSGGGTKGIAHAGAYQLLLEKNIEIDMISGSSAGAIVGCLISIGKNPQEILEFFQSIYFFHWKHLSLNIMGLVNASKFGKYLEPHFGDMTMGDLPIPVYITATDMEFGTAHVFSEDTLVVDAIIASSAFPGVVIPYKIGETLFSDGGILDNFPVDPIKNQCQKIIGIYVSQPQNVMEKQLKNIRDVTSRAFELATHHSEVFKFGYCDWLINIKGLAKYSIFETKKNKMQQIFDIGYKSAVNTFHEDW